MRVKFFREKIEEWELESPYFEMSSFSNNSIPEMIEIQRRNIKIKEIVYKGKLIRIAIENKLLDELIDNLLEENMELNMNKYKKAKDKEKIKYKSIAFYKR